MLADKIGYALEPVIDSILSSEKEEHHKSQELTDYKVFVRQVLMENNVPKAIISAVLNY